MENPFAAFMSRREVLSIAVLVLAVAALFYPFFLQGKILLPPNATSAYPWYGTNLTIAPHPQGSMDAVRENYITWAHHKTYLQRGDAPYWNPYLFAGNSLVANNFATPFSVYKLLNVLFSAPAAWSWAQILKTFFNGLFTYLALRALRRSETAATMGALAWMCSWPLAHQTQTTYNEGVAMLPIIFFFTLRSYQSSTRRQQWIYGIAAALVIGFHFLSGNIQMSVYVFLLLLGFALYWSWDQNRQAKTRSGRLRPLITLILVYLGGVLVGSVQIWTTYELLGLSIRGAAQTYQNKGILPYTEISFLNPWIYFWRNFEFPDIKDQYWLNDRWNPYIGIVPLFAMLLAVRFVRDRMARAVMGMTFGLLLVLHLLYFRPIFNAVSGLPGYNLLDQVRFLIVIPFPLVILAAYGMDWLLEEGPRNFGKLRSYLWLASLLLPLMLVGMLGLMLFFDGEVEQTRDLPIAVCTNAPEQENCSDSTTAFQNQLVQVGTKVIADYYSLENPLFILTFIYVGAGLVLIGMTGAGRLPRQAAGSGFILLTLVDVVIFAHINIAAADKKFVYPTTPAIEFLQKQEGIFRISARNNTLREGRPAGDYATYRDDHAWYLSSTLEPLLPNTAGLFGLQDVRGYESVYARVYSEYLAAIDGRDQIFGAGAWLTNTVTHPMLDMLNVRYILSIEPLEEPTLSEVYRGEIYIYENLNALPRVMLYGSYTILDSQQAVLAAMNAPDFDPRTQLYTTEALNFSPAAVSGEAFITRYDPNHVTIEVSTAQAAILVLGDMDYPGWKAYIDGKETEITRANYLFRAVVVDAGEHRVEFRYQSSVVSGSLAVSVISLSLLTAAGLVLLRRKVPALE